MLENKDILRPGTVMAGERDVRDYLSSRSIPLPDSMRIMDFSPVARAVGDHFGGRISEGMGRYPPLVVEIPSRDFERISSSLGMSRSGIYSGSLSGLFIEGTNLILVPRDEMSIPGRADVIGYHEITHYAASLAGGGPVFRTGLAETASPWFMEGLTEFFSSRIVGTTNSGGYPYETLSVLALEAIVGRDELRAAFSTNSFGSIARRVDAALGEGAFTEFLSAPNGAAALRSLVRRDQRSPPAIGRSAVEGDPIWRELLGTARLDDLLNPPSPSAPQ